MYKTEAKNTLLLAYPIILGELAQMSLHIISTAMIGTIGYKQLAATALVLNVIYIPFILGIGITIAVAQMVSMAHGRFDKQMISHYFYNGFWLCAVLAAVISLVLILSKNILYHLGQDAEVVRLAIPYMNVMSISIIPMMLFMALKQFTDGLQYTKTAMTLSVVSIPLNIFLNWLMIYGNWGMPRMELMGAGYATLITRTLIFIALGIVIFNHRIFSKYIAVSRNQWKFRKNTLKQLLKIGIPSSLQIAMEAGAFAISGILVGIISAKAQAAHQIALTCASFTFMVSLGLSQAGSIRVSNAFGLRKWSKISFIGKSVLIVAVLYGFLCGVFFILFKNRLPLFFNSDAEVISIAATLLIFAAVFQISDAVQAVSAGLLRGIKDVNTPTVFIAIAYWVLGLPSGYLFAFRYNMGANGIWLGFIVGLSFSAILLTYRFLKKISEKNKTVL
jgi:MATE family multidrug resistance protein